MPTSPQTVIGIPGRWPNRNDIVTAIASRSGGYLFAGMVIMKIGTQDACGMHNLGHPDAVVEADIPPTEAAQLLHTFAGYLLVENPTLKNRETFSIDAAAPRYRLVHEPCTMYEAGDLFHNPYGVWKLVPA
jgi:hypothetical protein